MQIKIYYYYYYNYIMYILMTIDNFKTTQSSVEINFSPIFLAH